MSKFNSKLLNLSIVKFFKAIIKGKDELFWQFIIKKNLLKHIVDIFLQNPNKSNLLHSSILEIFDYLSKEYNKKIVNHLMENYD